MATSIFNYNGSLLTVVQDGTISTSTSTIAFPGRGYPSYGEAINQDLLWIMQNFANVSPPETPTVGQLWFDTANQLIKFYSGSVWIPVGGAFIGPSAPAGIPQVGNFWYDTVNKQLRIWNGANWDLLGPLGSAINTNPENPNVPTFSSIDAIMISDNTTALHQIWRITVGGTLLAILSTDATFVPMPAITGFSTINPGFNINSSISSVGYYGDPNLFRGTQSNLPSINNTWNLGSPTLRFANIYAVNIDGVPTLPEFNSLVNNVATLSSNVATLDSEVSFILENIRIRLSAPLNVYVSTTGSDSNSGTISSPFLTLQHAWNYIIANIDANGFTITINIANGTYSAGVLCSGVCVGQNGIPVSFVGNTGSPSSVVISVSGSPCFNGAMGAAILISGMTVITSGANADCIDVSDGSIAIIGPSIIFGASSHFQLNASNYGIIQAFNNYTITGGATAHMNVGAGLINAGNGNTVTVVGTPAFSGAFAQASSNGTIAYIGSRSVFSGSATGVVYNVTLNGIIDTIGGGPSYFPGSTSGTISSGGQYA